MIRRDFLKNSTLLLSATLLPSLTTRESKGTINAGVQLYSVRKEMLEDATGTLKKLASMGYKEIESARSERGNYYGFSPKEIKNICDDLGLTIRSGHVHVDENFQKSLDAASEIGQEYLVCSSMPAKGQTVDNYKKVAEIFTQAGEKSKKNNIKFGYHNHSYEFEQENGQVLYEVLLNNTDPSLVHMELDLGWVIDAGKDPLDYFKRFPGRFPLWHLKDMDTQKKRSVEFGKGSLKIGQVLKNRTQSGLKYFFVEQEEYANSAFESLKEDIEYLKELEI